MDGASTLSTEVALPVERADIDDPYAWEERYIITPEESVRRALSKPLQGRPGSALHQHERAVGSDQLPQGTMVAR